MSNLLYPQEAACLVRMVEACGLVVEAMYITTHFVGARFVRIDRYGNGTLSLTLSKGYGWQVFAYEDFANMAALKAAYTID